MICKTLIHIKTKEFCCYNAQLGFIGTCLTPELLAETATIELLKTYHDSVRKQTVLKDEINWKRYRVAKVKVELVEKQKSKAWKTSEVRFLRENLHLTDGEIANALKRNKVAVASARKRYGIIKPGEHKFKKGQTPHNKGVKRKK